MNPAQPLTQLIDPSWAAALASVEPTIHEIGDRLRDEVANGDGYLPAGTDVLRAFTYPMDQVKVLIVGQDPYPTPGHAMGLSFSVAPGVRPPRSTSASMARCVTFSQPQPLWEAGAPGRTVRTRLSSMTP